MSNDSKRRKKRSMLSAYGVSADGTVFFIFFPPFVFVFFLFGDYFCFGHFFFMRDSRADHQKPLSKDVSVSNAVV